MWGEIDSYVRIVGYNLLIVIVLMIAANVRVLKLLLRAFALLMVVQQAIVWARVFGNAECAAWIQTIGLTCALWLVVAAASVTLLALSKTYR